MRLASSEIVAQLVDSAHQDLDRAAELWPFVTEQRLLGQAAARIVRLPTGQLADTRAVSNERCDRPICNGRPHGDWPFHHPARHDRETSPKAHSDRTGEQAVAGHVDQEVDDRKAQLMYLDALARLSHHARGVQDALGRIRKARVALGAMVPAVDAALNARSRGPNLDQPTVTQHQCRRCGGKQQVAGKPCDRCDGYGWTDWPDPEGPPAFRMTGRIGTSGVSLEEADRQRRGAVEAEAACLACDLGVSQVGRLKAGLCNTDYQAWWRAGQPDRGLWLAERRQYLADKDRQEADIIHLRPPMAENKAA